MGSNRPLDANQAREDGRKRGRPGIPIIVLACSFPLLLAGAVWTLSLARRVPGLAAGGERDAGTLARTPWKNARPGVKYVGDAACTRCHEDIADTFRRHPMGRSLAPIASAPRVGFDQADGSTTFEAGASRFTVERRGGREVHREAVLDEKGRPLAQVEAEVKYALGSGTRGVSYLVEHDGRLFQSPISWYSQKNKWDLSPGYEHRNLHFDRPIEPQCLFCHTNRVLPVDLTVNRYEEPIFRGHAIGCERCHGPGELHVRGQEVVGGQDQTIVNPRHLSPSLRGAVCEQCHILGDQRVERLGREPFDFRPGLASITFHAVFGSANEVGSKAVGHVEQMKKSRCFRESQGRLGCTSCHDPHQVPAREERNGYFRERCLACHERAGCKLPAEVRRAQSPDDSCIQCHMQKAKNSDVVHVAATDHRISRSPGNPVTEPLRPASELPLVLLNGDDLSRKELGSLGRELAIAVALEGPRLPNTPQIKTVALRVMSLLDVALKEHPDDLLALRMKAQVLALSRRRREALSLVDAVLRVSPSYEKALDQYLGYAIDEGETRPALAPARRAVALNPWSSALQERLAHIAIEHQQWDEAIKAARAALRLNPFLRFARMFLIDCLVQRGDLEHADEEFATLIKLNPGDRESLSQWFAEQRRDKGLPGSR